MTAPILSMFVIPAAYLLLNRRARGGFERAGLWKGLRDETV
jgi:hypothetical protein